jgi:hypothetical protein
MRKYFHCFCFAAYVCVAKVSFEEGDMVGSCERYRSSSIGVFEYCEGRSSCGNVDVHNRRDVNPHPPSLTDLARNRRVVTPYFL